MSLNLEYSPWFDKASSANGKVMLTLDGPNLALYCQGKLKTKFPLPDLLTDSPLLAIIPSSWFRDQILQEINRLVKN